MSADKKLLFLFSDTGGGHRSSCEAVEEAIHHLYPHKFEIDKVDFFKYYSPWPFSSSANLYPHMVKFHSRPWEISFNFSNNPQVFKKISDFLWPYIKPKLKQLFLDHPSDFIISFHPLVNRYLDLLNQSSKTVVVITDLVTAHSAWYSGHPLKYFVPTTEIKNTGIQLGVGSEKIVVTGLPVSLKFKPKTQSLNQLNHLITILLMGGGQGLGKIYSIAQSLNNSNLLIKLIIVAGRNPKLEQNLRSLNWKIPVEIHGFTKNIPDLMQKSDLLLTKAGPSTICEGLVSGLPIILYDYLKGQETASVDYVVKNGAGFYCPDPPSLYDALEKLNHSTTSISQLTQNAVKLSKPQASLDIARGLYQLFS